MRKTRFALLFSISALILASCRSPEARDNHAGARPADRPAAPLPYATRKCTPARRDAVSGVERLVVPDVKLSARREAVVDLTIGFILGRSFIPAAVAESLSAHERGEVDLASTDPETLARLPIVVPRAAGLTRFREVEIDRIDLGVGPPFGPVRALVLDDALVAFGVMGADWFGHHAGAQGLFHAAAVQGCTHGGLLWGDLAPKSAQ